jgi:hypothetical protein
MKKILIHTSGFPKWKGDGITEFMQEYAKEISAEFEVFLLPPERY